MEKSKSHLGEVTPNQESDNNIEKNRLERVAKILELVEKINESNESTPFPGIHSEIYERIKKSQEEFPDYVTPIDEIIERCKKEGIKVVLSKDPGSGNVFILPIGSTNIQMDSIEPSQLVIDNVDNEYLRELIQLKPKNEYLRELIQLKAKKSQT